MICPHCQHPASKVIDSRPSADTIKRYRRCLRCGKHFSTQEYTADQLAAYVVAQRNDLLESLRLDLIRLAGDAGSLVRKLAMGRERR